ncbi:RNA-directed DNA polymerase [Salix suchowensis]|nr:RNA-directed DNA polymerase [Salix suchowensis]
MYATSLTSRYMARPTDFHLQAAKRILRYLKGTASYGIHYKRNKGSELEAYTDSDYAGDMDDRKSTSGYAFLLSSGAISWGSKKQPIVTLSTTEAEFVAAAVCVCQAIWLRRVLNEMGHGDDNCMQIKCDNSKLPYKQNEEIQNKKEKEKQREKRFQVKVGIWCWWAWRRWRPRRWWRRRQWRRKRVRLWLWVR